MFDKNLQCKIQRKLGDTSKRYTEFIFPEFCELPEGWKEPIIVPI
jgi:uncharacterized protein YbdZ (MbtH family)